MQETHPPSQEFALKPGERITDCVPLTAVCDRILQELGSCHYCRHSVYRVITITTSKGLEHRAVLCEHHFADAALSFPELKSQPS
jgi:hypothetical protein